jgi:PAS domain-containing protein
MSTPREIPSHNEHDRLRDHIVRLEEELAQLRRSLADAELGSGTGPQTATDNYYKEVFDHLSVCMFFIDVTPDGRFRYAGFNPAEEEALGLSTEQVTGKFVEEVSHRTLRKSSPVTTASAWRQEPRLPTTMS